jgi:hypothetical protein
MKMISNLTRIYTCLLEPIMQLLKKKSYSLLKESNNYELFFENRYVFCLKMNKEVTFFFTILFMFIYLKIFKNNKVLGCDCNNVFKIIIHGEIK